MTTYKKVSIIILKKVPLLKTLKMLLFIQPIKRIAKQKNQTIDQLAFCLIYLRFTNDFYMYTYFSNFFPQYKCGFRKGYNAQHCIIAVTEKMKEARDNNKASAAVLTDLSKSIWLSFARSSYSKITCLRFWSEVLESYPCISKRYDSSNKSRFFLQ